MPNIASVLKDEIARLARKELRGENAQLKKSSAQFRSEIAALKRRLMALEKLVQRLGKGGTRKSAAASDDADNASAGLRFSAKGLATKRKRLGLSAAEMAALMGVSAQSIYKWEEGKNRPRASQLPAIASVRGLGKREALARLAELAATAPVVEADKA